MRNRTSNSLLTFALFLLPFFASAQYDDLLQNKDITWIAEFQTEHCFNLDARELGGNDIDLRYFQAPAGPSSAPNGHWLTWWLLDDLRSGTVKAFSDAQLKNPILELRLTQLGLSNDTIIDYDPVNYEERIQVISNGVRFDKIRFFRTRQIIYQDGRDGRLHTRLVAMAPLLTLTDFQGQPTGEFAPLAWMPMNDVLSEKLDFAAPFSWAATVKAPLNIDGLQTVKGNLNVQQQLYQEALGGNRKVVEPSNDHDAEIYLTPKQVEQMISSTDTMEVFDPMTYEGAMRIIRSDMKLEDIEQLQIVQDWYYDPQQHLLVNRLRALGPRCNVTDVNGNFEFTKPIFYIVY